MSARVGIYKMGDGVLDLVADLGEIPVEPGMYFVVAQDEHIHVDTINMLPFAVAIDTTEGESNGD